MTTSTPPAWRWLSECDAPVTVAELSFGTPKTSESDASRVQNDSDQCANGEQCPPSALIPSDQCDECRSAPGRPHATGCEGTAPLTDSVSNVAPSHRIGTCYLDPDTGETVMPADFFGEKELRWKTDKDGNLDDEPSLVKVESCPECGTVADIDYGNLNQVTEEGLSNPLHAHMWETFNQCLSISRHKNADYANDSDPLANFRACQKFGVTLPQGIMVRLSDKFARIGNLLDGRDPAVSDERLEDTIQDAINYLAILAYALDAE